MIIHARRPPASRLPTHTTLLLLLLFAGFGTSVEAQIPGFRDAPAAHSLHPDGYYIPSVLPETVIERLRGEALPLAQVLAEGLTVEGEDHQQTPIVFSIMHLRDGKVASQFTTRPTRSVGGRVPPGALGLDGRLPTGQVVGGIGSVRMDDRMIVKSGDLTGSGRSYPAAEFLDRAGALANIDWARNEALYILPIPANAQQRENATMRGILVLFEPDR